MLFSVTKFTVLLQRPQEAQQCGERTPELKAQEPADGGAGCARDGPRPRLSPCPQGLAGVREEFRRDPRVEKVATAGRQAGQWVRGPRGRVGACTLSPTPRGPKEASHVGHGVGETRVLSQARLPSSCCARASRQPGPVPGRQGHLQRKECLWRGRLLQVRETVRRTETPVQEGYGGSSHQSPDQLWDEDPPAPHPGQDRASAGR